MSTVEERATQSTTIDGVMLAILSKRLEGIVRKMHNTLLRTARSGVINNGRDFSCCILTDDARLLTLGESLPIHLMVGSDMMAQSMKDLHPQLQRGDAFIHNSPYHGCSHAADQSILVPVFDDHGVHWFTAIAKAHQADIGNAMPTTYMLSARDVYEEGALIFPAVRVQQDYRDIEDIIRMCMMRIRVPDQWRGDYMAALGAARIAERELLVLGEEVGWEVLHAYQREWFQYSERRMVAALQKLPSGRTTACSTHDPFPGTPPTGIPVNVTVDIDAEAGTIEVDLRDNLDCLPNGLNLSEACARTAAMIGIFNSIEPGLPSNAGSFRRIRVHLRENCVVGIPRHPASCSIATTNVADRVTNAVQRAIAEFADGYGMAEAGAVQSPAGAVISGFDPRSGDRAFVNQLQLGDTLGAAGPSEDGWLTLFGVGSAGQCLWDSVEVDEMLYPIRVRERRIVTDSEGAGEYCGAPASFVEFGPVDCSLRVIYVTDGTLNAPLGARGGLTGARAETLMRKASGEQVPITPFGDQTLAPGESIIGISCSGAGYGEPRLRDPTRVERDVAEGYVTRERAKEIYRVVLDENGAIDYQQTKRLRAETVSRE